MAAAQELRHTEITLHYEIPAGSIIVYHDNRWEILSDLKALKTGRTEYRSLQRVDIHHGGYSDQLPDQTNFTLDTIKNGKVRKVDNSSTNQH